MKIDGKDIALFNTRVWNNGLYLFVYNTEKKISKEIVVMDSDIDFMSKLEAIVYIFYSTEAQQKVCYVGWKCHTYSCFVINYIIEHIGTMRMCDVWFFMKSIDKDVDKDYTKYFFSIDLCKMLFPEKQRCSLRKMIFSMGLELSEFETPEIKSLDIDEIYSIVNAESKCLLKIFDKYKTKLSYRRKLFDAYNVNCLSSDDAIIGLKLMTKRYSQISGRKYSEYSSLRSTPRMYKVGDLIKFDYQFQNSSLREFISRFKELHLSPTDSGKKAYSETIFVNNIPLSITQSAVRSLNTPHIFKGAIVNIDVQSMFPSIACAFNLFPSHLSEDFGKVYKSMVESRLAAKKEGNELKSDSLKLILNSVIGMMNNDWSWLYDPNTALSIRLNSIVLMLSIIDKCLSLGKILQVNTDGLFLLVPENSDTLIFNIPNIDFDLPNGITLKYTQYRAMFQYSVNDYVAVKDDGEIVRKGIFSPNEVGKHISPIIVKEAVENYLINNIPIRNTIDECNDVSKYCITKEFGDCFIITDDKVKVHNLLRYYYSDDRNAYKLVKTKDGKSNIADNTSGVCVCENFYNQKRINKRPYYAMANEIVSKFHNNELFDIFV